MEERHAPVWRRDRRNWEAGPLAAVRMAFSELRLLSPARGYDALIVGYPGHFDLPAARRAAWGRPVVFNPLVSLADTLVGDRGRFRPGSLTARVLGAVDRRAFRSADLVVADTDAHADFFSELAGIPRSRIEVCLVGAEERVFRPAWDPEEPFTALFVGKMIPLQGVETILAAARLAPELSFRLIGSGQLDELLEERPPNVDWRDWIEYEQIPEELGRAGCALGIFGTSAKAGRVIPNKVYQALACGTPVVTADTRAAHELLVDGESALLVPPGDPHALVAALRRLAGDPELARHLSGGGLYTFQERASEAVLGRRWQEVLERAVHDGRA